MNHRYLILLAAGHLITDAPQGAVSALLPFLIEKHNITYAAAASLVFALSVSSSVAQPLFGHLSDLLSKPWLMPLGVGLAGVSLALTGVAPNYPSVFLTVAICGIGVAAFHPEAVRLSNAVAGKKKATAVSIFGVGGTAGFALGPILVTSSLLLWGLKGTLVFALPAIVMAALLMGYLPRFAAYYTKPQKKQADSMATVPDDWRSFGRLIGVITFRSMIFYAMNTFIPLYWVGVLHQSKTAGGTALTVLFVSGVAGTLLGGRLADRYGDRQVIRGGFGILIPLLIFFAVGRDATLLTLLLVPIGLAQFASYSPMIVLGQKYLPNRMGLASGVTIGLTVSIGGAFAPLLGWVADHQGLQAVFVVLACLPVLGIAMALTLTRPRVDRRIK